MLNKVEFPYGQLQIDEYYNTLKFNSLHKIKKSKPISYSIEDNGEYYIVKISLETEYDCLNYSKVDGVIGIDSNLGFYSTCNISSDGNLIETLDYRYDWYKKKTTQTEKGIENCAKRIVDRANELCKPIVIEDLNIKTKSKLKNYNDNKNRNFKKSMFAHKKMITALVSCAHRNGVEVYFINPAYTSFIGKEKYMPVYKRSIHQLAAYTIGRKGLGYVEKLKNDLYYSWKDYYDTMK